MLARSLHTAAHRSGVDISLGCLLPNQPTAVVLVVPAGIVGGDADNNIVELAKVGAEDFQLNVKDTLTPFQTIGCALSSICAEK